MRYVSAIAFVVVLAACKPAKNSDLATLDNFALNSGARMNVCSANALDGESFEDFTRIPLRINIEQSLEAKTDALIENVQIAVSAVPPQFQAMFHDLNGSIEVVQSASARCTGADAKNVGYDVLSCIQRRAGGSGSNFGFNIIIEGTEAAIQHGLVRAFGQLMVEAVASLHVNPNNGQALIGAESVEFQEDSEKLAMAFIKDMVNSSVVGNAILDAQFGDGSLQLIRAALGRGVNDYRKLIGELKHLSAEEKSAQAVVFRDLVVAEAFDSYVCNDWFAYDKARAEQALRTNDVTLGADALRNTHRVMRDFFPGTYAVFKPMFQTYTDAALQLGSRTFSQYYGENSTAGAIKLTETETSGSGFNLAAVGRAGVTSTTTTATKPTTSSTSSGPIGRAGVKTTAKTTDAPKSTSSEPGIFSRIASGASTAGSFAWGATKGVAKAGWSTVKGAASAVKYTAVGTGRYAYNAVTQGPIDAAVISGNNVATDYKEKIYKPMYQRTTAVTDNLFRPTSQGGAGMAPTTGNIIRASGLSVTSAMFDTQRITGIDYAAPTMTQGKVTADSAGQFVGGTAFDLGTMFVAPGAAAPKIGAAAVKATQGIKYVGTAVKTAAVPLAKVSAATSAARQRISNAFMTERRLLSGMDTVGTVLPDAELAALRANTVEGLRAGIPQGHQRAFSSLGGNRQPIDLNDVVFAQGRKNAAGVGGGVYEQGVLKKIDKGFEDAGDFVAFTDPVTKKTRYVQTDGHHRTTAEIVNDAFVQRRYGPRAPNLPIKIEGRVLRMSDLDVADQQRVIQMVQENGATHLDIWRPK